MNISQCYDVVNENDTKQFINGPSALIELDLGRYQLTWKAAVYLIKKLKSSRHFRFAYIDRYGRRDFENELNNNGLQVDFHLSLHFLGDFCEVELIR